MLSKNSDKRSLYTTENKSAAGPAAAADGEEDGVAALGDQPRHEYVLILRPSDSRDCGAQRAERWRSPCRRRSWPSRPSAAARSSRAALRRRTPCASRRRTRTHKAARLPARRCRPSRALCSTSCRRCRAWPARASPSGPSCQSPWARRRAGPTTTSAAPPPPGVGDEEPEDPPAAAARRSAPKPTRCVGLGMCSGSTRTRKRRRKTPIVWGRRSTNTLVPGVCPREQIWNPDGYQPDLPMSYLNQRSADVSPKCVLERRAQVS